MFQFALLFFSLSHTVSMPFAMYLGIFFHYRTTNLVLSLDLWHFLANEMLPLFHCHEKVLRLAWGG